MNKTTIDGVTISEVKRKHAWWLYLWPFQSRRELLSTFAILGVVLSVMGTFAYLTAPYALLNTLVGAAVGGVYLGVYGALPASLTLATRSEARHFLADLQAMLAKGGYVLSEQPIVPGRFHYRSKMPRLLRWDSQDIELLVHGNEFVLNGPITPLRLLRAKLLPDSRAYLKA